MARRQVLVQLDDELVERLDALAANVGTSRSALLRQAGWAVIHAHDVAAADRHLVEAYRRQPQDPQLTEAARRLAADAAPPW